METVFWTALIGAIYSYFLYPLVLLAVPRRSARPMALRELPGVSVIIAARNEASRIEARIDNLLASRYPAERLEIIVASDASTDRTDAIARRYADRGVRLVRSDRRLGKEHVQQLAVAAARGGILIFSDAATLMEPDGLREIVLPFSDPSVGAVSSEDRFIDAEGRPAGEGLYVRYEMWLRRVESRAAGLIGLSGSLFAARREVCRDWDSGAQSDFNTALNCARSGYVAVAAPEARGYYRDLRGAGEYRRKYRTVLRGIASLWRHRAVLDPRRHGLFAFQLWSHKVMRWAVPWCLPALLMASFRLEAPFYRAALAAQLLFYGLVAAGFFSKRLRRAAAVRIPYFFVEANAAIAHATLAFVAGRRITAWEPSRR